MNIGMCCSLQHELTTAFV